jgi:hypothetical protein
LYFAREGSENHDKEEQEEEDEFNGVDAVSGHESL